MTQIPRRTLKHRTVRLMGAALLLSAVTFFFAFASTALAWDDCPFGEVDCVYPGDCSRYVDTNGDGICDRSQPEPTSAATETTETVVASADETGAGTTDAGVAADTLSDTDFASDEVVAATGDEDRGGGRRRGEETATDSAADASTSDTDTGDAAVAAIGESGTGGNGGSGYSFLTHYYVSPIAIAFFLVYAVSFVLYKTRRMRVATHRKIWNVLLLLTFLITGVFGLLLTIQLDYTLPLTIPFDMLFWHVEAGVVMTLISLFHIGWHFKYYKNMLRTSRAKARAAEAAERSEAALRAGRRRPARGPAAEPALEPIPVTTRTQTVEGRRIPADARE